MSTVLDWGLAGAEGPLKSLKILEKAEQRETGESLEHKIIAKFYNINTCGRASDVQKSNRGVNNKNSLQYFGFVDRRGIMESEAGHETG
jgi:hypothetical protein